MRGTKLSDWGLKAPEFAPSRRSLFTLVVGSGAGLALGLAGPGPAIETSAAADGPKAFNPFVQVTPDNKVVVTVKHLDKGQGIATGLATLIAEEMDADRAQIETQFAPVNDALYKNLFFGVMGTGGSTGIANSWLQYRSAGAAARAMLVAAAAKRWGVPVSDISVSAGVVSAGSRTATFGDLAAEAASMPVPDKPVFKDPSKYVYIGKSFPRVDTVAKSTGQPLYTLDVRLPGMLTAVVAHPTKFGAKVKSFDAAKAKAVPGVVDVVAIKTGVAVVAKSTWAAIKGREALSVVWDESAAETRSSDAILSAYVKLAGEPGIVAHSAGDAEARLKTAAKVVEATYTFPYLAHATMEPMNAVVEMKDGRAIIHTGSQMPSIDRNAAASVLGLKPEEVEVRTLWAGGSFGRRAVPVSDYVVEAASIVKARGKSDPVKLVWTREDDLAGGFYRPLTVHKVRAGLDAQGNLIAWHHRIAGQPILLGTPFGGMVKGGIDPTLVGGVFDSPYLPPDARVEAHFVADKVPVLWWRSVENTHSAFVMECMMDELAVLAGQDPAAFRMNLLKSHPRHLAVARLALEKSGYGKAPLPEGTAMGFAVHESFKTYVAEVATVRMEKSGPKVVSVVAAIDCGIPVNPDNIRAQVEGGIAYGLGAALHSKITMKGGVVEQTNFDGYQVLRFDEMPKVDVHIVPSAEAPTGIGEPGVPPIGPAVANAIAKLTGKRVRDLPFDDALKPAKGA